MRVEKKNKAFAYRIYSHFTQQCTLKPNAYNNKARHDLLAKIVGKSMEPNAASFVVTLESGIEVLRPYGY